MKICPKCLSKMKDDVNFCTKCGTKLTDVEPQATVDTAQQQSQSNSTDGSQQTNNTKQAQAAKTSIDTQAIQSALQGYWSWLLGSWKSPFKAQKTTKYAGILTLFLESLFFTLGIGHGTQKAASAATNAANSFLGAFSSSNSSTYNSTYSVGFGFYFAIILIILIAAVAMIGIAFLIRRAVGGAAVTETFIDYLNRLAHYSSSILLLTLVFFLIAISGSVGLVSMLVISILLILISLVWTITIICGVVQLENGGQLDRIYGAVITGVICMLIEGIAVSLVVSKLGDTAGSFISSMFGGGL